MRGRSPASRTAVFLRLSRVIFITGHLSFNNDVSITTTQPPIKQEKDYNTVIAIRKPFVCFIITAFRIFFSRSNLCNRRVWPVPSVLTTGQCSKDDKVRVFRVVCNPKNQIHGVIKYDVTALVGGRSEN